jgi:hypothetical protein
MATAANITPFGIREAFMVLVDFGPKLGRAFVERDIIGIADRDELIKDVRNGQFEYPNSAAPIQIMHIKRDGTWADVTAEIFAESLDLAEAA